MQRAARLALVEAAILALLRDAGPEIDGIDLAARGDAGQVVIDLSYTCGGMPVAGQSL
jgi:hypothetical protein